LEYVQDTAMFDKRDSEFNELNVDPESMKIDDGANI
jgi:hypothetical protein